MNLKSKELINHIRDEKTKRMTKYQTMYDKYQARYKELNDEVNNLKSKHITPNELIIENFDNLEFFKNLQTVDNNLEIKEKETLLKRLEFILNLKCFENPLQSLDQDPLLSRDEKLFMVRYYRTKEQLKDLDITEEIINQDYNFIQFGTMKLLEPELNQIFEMITLRNDDIIIDMLINILANRVFYNKVHPKAHLLTTHTSRRIVEKDNMFDDPIEVIHLFQPDVFIDNDRLTEYLHPESFDHMVKMYKLAMTYDSLPYTTVEDDLQNAYLSQQEFYKKHLKLVYNLPENERNHIVTGIAQDINLIRRTISDHR